MAYRKAQRVFCTCRALFVPWKIPCKQRRDDLIDAPTAARKVGLPPPYGEPPPTFWAPKASKGERREAGIQWIQPPKAVSDPEFRQTTSGAHGSANRADCLPRGKPFGAPAGADLLFPMGTDAPTAAREWDLQSKGAFILFLRWRKKSAQKKASGTATTGKSPLLPILTAGLAMSRAMELDSYHLRFERARAHLFPPSKWAGLFPCVA